MLVTHARKKLINAIVFFASNTKHCGKIKLFKLLYLLDFEHFAQTGRSVTGADYRAWKMGPVPFGLVQEWDALEPDLAASVDIIPNKVVDYTRETVIAKIPFDDSYFSKREIGIMNNLVKQLCEDYSKPMIDITHSDCGAWAKIWDDGRGNNGHIPYRLAISDDDPHRDAILQAAKEFEGILAAEQ